MIVLQRKASMQQNAFLLMPAIKGDMYINTHCNYSQPTLIKLYNENIGEHLTPLQGVYPLRISDYIKQRETKVNLLLISDGERQHYCWIKNMSSLLYGQTSKHHGERRYCLR